MAHVLWPEVTTDEMTVQLQEAADAGAGIIRVDVGWSTLEGSGKGIYTPWYLTRLDALVAAANDAQIRLLLTFVDSPCWASSAPPELKQGCSGEWWKRGVQRYAPTAPQDYADALSFVADRYRGSVAGWEIWNEPNHPHYFRAADPAAEYAALLRAGSTAIRSADPGALVVGGALANADVAFTKQLLTYGVKGSFDVFAIHPYSEDRSPLAPAIPGWVKVSFAPGIPLVHKALATHGITTPIWLTEFGWSTCTIRNSTESWTNCVDEDVQADYIREAFLALKNMPYVGAAFVYELRDRSDEEGAWDDNYGLITHDGSRRKPAFYALRDAALAADEPPPGQSLAVRRFTLQRKRLTLLATSMGQRFDQSVRLVATVRSPTKTWVLLGRRETQDGAIRWKPRLPAAARGANRLRATVRLTGGEAPHRANAKASAVRRAQ